MDEIGSSPDPHLPGSKDYLDKFKQWQQKQYGSASNQGETPSPYFFFIVLALMFSGLTVFSVYSEPDMCQLMGFGALDMIFLTVGIIILTS